MGEAAEAFVGMRDFESFRAADRAGEHGGGHDEGVPSASTLGLVDRLDIEPEHDLILIGIEGSHFLWKMVRRVVGVLVEIGRGGLDPAAAARFLSTPAHPPA